MKKYLAVFLGTAASMEKWNKLTEEERKAKEKAGMEGWMKWVQDNEKSIVEGGSPLGKTKKVDKNGITDVRNDLAAWAVVQAESQEAAAKLFEKHPHFMLFPGDAVEIMECLPIPNM
jgi:hypothetical protein